MTLSLFFAIGTTTVITLGASFSLLYIYQTELLYPAKYRKKSREFTVPNFGEQVPFTETILTTNDKIRIRAYICKQPTMNINEVEDMVDEITVLALHSQRSTIVEKLYKEFKCNVVLLSYRGYGKSDGKPTEYGIKIDAQTALDYIKNHYILKNTKVVLYGRSLGGAVAIDLASKNEDKIVGLIVENTFLSIPKLVTTYFTPFHYLTFICSQIWPSHQSITKLHTIPILFLSGKQDKLIPQSQMKSLYDLTNTKLGKCWKEFPDGKHSDMIFQSGYFETIGEFLKNYVETHHQYN